MAWEDAYRGFDDASLALLATPGLVRRAAKTIVEQPPSWESRDEGTVRVGDVVVRLDATGPAGARCPCPVAGVCLHVLVAAMFVRDAADEARKAEGPVVDVLAEVLGLDPAAVCRAAGVAAVREAYGQLQGIGTPGAELVVDGPRLTITWPGHEVRYLAGTGFAGMVSAGSVAERLEALVRAFGTGGREWTWPDSVTAAASPSAGSVGLSRAQTDLLDAVRAGVADMLAAGLSHVTPESADRLDALGVAARVDALPLLARFIGAASGRLDALARHADDMPEGDALAGLARVWALTRALEAAGPEALPRLVGDVRRSFDDAPSDLDLLPLGARWWVADSGARGVTLVVWDTRSSQFRSVTTSRPAGVDAGFVRSVDASYFWGAPLTMLLGAPFRLQGARLAADGTLSPTADRVVRSGRFTEVALRAITTTDWGEVAYSPPRFGRFATAFHLLEPARRDAMTIDEPRQEVVWPLAGADGTRLEVRQPIDDDVTTRIDTLLAVDGLPVQFVLVSQAPGGAVQPVAVFLRATAGPELISLDFATLPPKATGLLARWWAARRRRDASRMAPVAPRPATALLADDVRDLCADVAATGRPLSASQRAQATTYVQRAADLALAHLARALEGLIADTGPEALLRTRLLADRLADLDGALPVRGDR